MSEFRFTATFTHAGRQWAEPVSTSKHAGEWTLPDIHDIILGLFRHVGVEPLGELLAEVPVRDTAEQALTVYADDHAVTIGPLPIPRATFLEYLDCFDDVLPTPTETVQ